MILAEHQGDPMWLMDGEPQSLRSQWRSGGPSAHNPAMGQRILAALMLLAMAACAEAQPSLRDCEAMCKRQGQSVGEYVVGTQVPIFKPRPSVICRCSGNSSTPSP